MRKKIVALVGVLSFLAIGGSRADNAQQSETTSISFDGFCNVMQITVFPWHQAGTVETSCQTGRVGAGMEGKVKGASWKGKTLTIGENPDVSNQVYLYNIQYPLVNGGGWSLYTTSDGVSFSYLNSGTYTITGEVPDSRHSGPSTDGRVKR